MKHTVAKKICEIKKCNNTMKEDNEITEEDIRCFSSILTKDLNFEVED